jgi:thiol-disulfide isomerase/thioredoxin
MLLFVAPDCGPCSTLTPDIVRWQTEYAPAIGFALVSSGSVEANQAKVAARGAKRVLLQKNFEVGKAYGVSGTPSAIIVHPDGTIASPLAGGADTIRALLDQYVEALAYEAGVELEDEGEVARAARAAASPLQIRAPAPDLEFRDLTGKIVRLVDFRGRGTVLLFWSLSCRFCREMLPDLREWEAARPRGAPDLLVILATPPGAGQAVSFLSPVMMDRESAAAQALHANGTPTAVLIDADGNVASQPAVGAVPVLELLGWTPMEEERASA